jgi:hypothetical protein
MFDVRRRWLLAAAVACVGLVGGAQAQEGALRQPSWRPADVDGWSLQWPADQTKLSYFGVVNHDGAGAGPAGGMLYPAPNFGGFIVAVLTHAALNEGVKSSQRTAIQASADAVLADYQDAINTFTPVELMRRVNESVMRQSASLRTADQARWIVEVRPIFWMTQDRRALIVDNELVVKERGDAEVVRRSTARVVGGPLETSSSAATWSEEGGERLKRESAQLLAQAIQLAMADMEGRWDRPATPYRTIRFPEGGQERIERVQLLEAQCDRGVARNLRGDLIAIPLVAPVSGQDSASCSREPAQMGPAPKQPSPAQ